MSENDTVLLVTCPLTGAHRTVCFINDQLYLWDGGLLLETNAKTSSASSDAASPSSVSDEAVLSHHAKVLATGIHAQSVRAAAFVPIPQGKFDPLDATTTAAAGAAANGAHRMIAEVSTTATTTLAPPAGSGDRFLPASAFMVIGGDKKTLDLVHIHTHAATDGGQIRTTVAVVSQHGPAEKKISHIAINIDASITADHFATAAVHQQNAAAAAAAATSTATAPTQEQQKRVGAVVFADKFGEVYIVPLLVSRSGLVLAPAAVFALQHTASVLSAMLLTAYPSCNRRLITCDRDAHLRVSKYPATYVIEQFLWSPESPQSPITCLFEIRSGPAFERLLLATGDAAGRVNIWAAVEQTKGKEAGDAEGQPSFALVATYNFSTDALRAAGSTGIVGLAQVHGVLAVFVDKAPTAALIPLRIHENSVGIAAPLPGGDEGVVLLPLPSPVVAVSNNDSVTSRDSDLPTGSALLLHRDGHLSTLAAPACAAGKVLETAASDIAISTVSLSGASLWQQNVASTPPPTTTTVAPALTADVIPAFLGAVDLSAQWRSRFAENKSKRAEGNKGGNNSDDEDED